MRPAEGTGRRPARTTAGATVEMLEDRRLLATWIVSPTGSDQGSGTLDSPWRTIQHALDLAVTGDVVALRAGEYAGEVWINTPGLTLRSYATESARITLPTGDTRLQVVVHVNADANNTTIQNLEITGGRYYAVKTETTWDSDPVNPHGPSGLSILNSSLHDTGADVIKLTPATSHVTISGSEIYNSGLRQPDNAEGIDGVQANFVTVTNNYIHDIATNGIYLKGGSTNSLIERNRVYRCGYSGIILGQTTDPPYFNTTTNPDYYESIDGVVCNNIVVSTVGAGIAAWCALRPQVYNNTLYDVAQSWFGGLLIQAEEHWVPKLKVTASRDVTMYNNIVLVNGDRPELEIRSNGIAGALTLGNNLYWHPGGATLIRDLTRSFEGTLAAWQAIGQDPASLAADPQLDPTRTYQPGSTSPAIDHGRVSPATVDYLLNPRPAGAAYDIGAYEYIPEAPPVLAPSSFTATPVGPATINVAWINNATNATSLTLQHATDSAFQFNLTTINLGPTTSSYAVGGLASNTTYYLRLQAVAGASASAWVMTSATTLPTPVVPNPPGTPVASEVTSSSATLLWTASPPGPAGSTPTQYILERAANNSFSSGLVRYTLPATQLTYTDASLLPLVSYFYRVIATNVAGSSNPSGTLQITTLAGNHPPTIVEPASASPAPVIDSTATLHVVAADNGGASTLVYTWTVRNRPADAPMPLFSINASNAASTTIVQFGQVGTYTVDVTITDDLGLSISSSLTLNVVGVTVVTPIAPQDLRADTSMGLLLLTWTNLDALATTFTLERSTSPDFANDVVIDTLPPASDSAAIDGLLSNVTYYLRLRANGSTASSPWSSLSIKTPGWNPVPGAPEQLARAATPTNQVALSWLAPTGGATPTAYYVERAFDPGFTTKVTRTLISSGTAHLDTSVKPGQTWYYRVIAINSAGWSNPTAALMAVIS